MGLYPLFQLLGPCLAASPIAMGASRCATLCLVGCWRVC